MPEPTSTQPAPLVLDSPTARTEPAQAVVRPSVWLTGQTCSRDQRRGRYLQVSNAHPAKMLPSIARQLITTYTQAKPPTPATPPPGEPVAHPPRPPAPGGMLCVPCRGHVKDLQQRS